MQPSTHSLDAVFYPSSIAIIGASRDANTIGGRVFSNLLRNDFKGVIYPVNPNAKFIQAVRAYPTITAIPDPVEMAVIVVPARLVLDAARESIKKGVKALVVISAGFAEKSAEGKVAEKELLDLCRASGVRLVGPNCLGVVNVDPAACMDATFAPIFPPPGNIAFLSQSGALGVAIIAYAKELGIGISKFISVGNRADVSANDLIEYWAEDEKSSVILLYLESFGNPKRFLEIARRVNKKKPIVAVKSGRSKSGARAAASHTGALAASETPAEALFEQTGVIRTDTVEQLFDVAMFIANQPLPKGRNVGILTNAGGPGILAADACEQMGLKVPEWSPETVAKIQLLVPDVATIRNPVDTTAEMSPERLQKAIPILLADPAIDTLLVIHVPPLITKTKEIAEAIISGSEKSGKPIVTCFFGKQGVMEGMRSLQSRQIPSFIFPESAVTSIARAADYYEWKNKPDGKVVTFSDFDEKKIRELTRKPGWMEYDKVFELLEAAKISVAPPGFAKTPQEAGKMARTIGFPVVLKLAADGVLHRSDVGGVAVNLQKEQDVVGECVLMNDRAKAAGVKAEQLRGYYVQPMVEGGKEIIIGANHDPRFGHLFMFGLGGVHVEVMRDVAFRLHPLTDLDVNEMVREIRGVKLLEGYRGSEPCDLGAIEEMIHRMAQLVSLVPHLEQFDLNPVRVFPSGVRVLDARICLGVNCA